MVFSFGKKILTLGAVLLLNAPLFAAEKWNASVPKIADNSDAWKELIPALMDNGMYYGALASAQNMLNFFSDLPSKELAYQTIIKLIDQGYPFSTRVSFVPGDLDPSTFDNFAQSYLVYKGIVNVDKHMDKWAEYYFNKVDKANFPKYLFYQATLAYQKHMLPEAVLLLKQTLAKSTAPEHATLAKKASRTLARIYYETGEFAKSQEIYETFLLKLIPIAPDDWLESAWNLYQLKRYSEALGHLYNFESKSVGPFLQIEKYVLRALIYREYCSTDATEALIKSFEKEFGPIIEGIKMGQPLSSFPLLMKIEHPETLEYRQSSQTLLGLNNEWKSIRKLPVKMQELAKYIYTSEIKLTKRRRQLTEDAAQDILARHLTILGESLRFLKFDVAREKFSPDRVFMEPALDQKPLIDSTDEQSFRLHWLQWGDYMRDERSQYHGVLEDKCKP